MRLLELRSDPNMDAGASSCALGTMASDVEFWPGGFSGLSGQCLGAIFGLY